MRFADGGGLTVHGRSRREQVRLRAAGMFAQDTDARQVASSLRVSTKSVYQWRRAWRAAVKRRWRRRARAGPLRAGRGAGRAAARGAGGRPGGLRLGAGPAVDPGRVAMLIERLFSVSYTLRGVSFLLHRLGFSPQVPAHRAFERDEDAVAEWRSATWAKVRG